MAVEPGSANISGLSISSVLLGELVDKTLFVPLVVGLVAFVDSSTLLFSVLALAIGTFCTTAGAYFSAHRARRLFLTHAIGVSVLTFVLSFIRFLVAQSSDEPSVHPLWWEFVGWTLVFLAGYAGGYLARSRAQPTAV